MSPAWHTVFGLYCLAVALFGAAIAGGVFPATQAPIALFYDLVGARGVPFEDEAMRFTLGVLGAVTIGWAVTLYAAILAAIRLGPEGRPVWLLLVGAVLVWFVVDSALSIATGFGLNVIPNTAFAGAFLAALAGSGALAATRHRPPAR